MIDGRFGPDALEGGEGTDTVTYGGSRRPAGFSGRTTAVNATIDVVANDGGMSGPATARASRQQ